jgi:SSS family solute:Na+ symporter
MAAGILMFAVTIPSTIYTFNIGGQKLSVFEALSSVILNFIVVVVLTLVFRAAGLSSGKDVTRPADYEAAPKEGVEPVPEALG